MTSRRTLAVDKILSILIQEDKNEDVEDHLSEDNVQSDFEDEFVDNEPEKESHLLSDGEDLSQSSPEVKRGQVNF